MEQPIFLTILQDNTELSLANRPGNPKGSNAHPFPQKHPSPSVSPSGVVVISDEDHSITPSANIEEIREAGDAINDVAIVVVNREDGELIASMLHTAETSGTGQLMLAIAPPIQYASESGVDGGLSDEEARQKARDTNRILYLNGHPLVNTRLMV